MVHLAKSGQNGPKMTLFRQMLANEGKKRLADSQKQIKAHYLPLKHSFWKNFEKSGFSTIFVGGSPL